MIVEYVVGMEQELQALVKAVFDKFVGYEYSAQGCQTFYGFIEPTAIRTRVQSGNILLVYKDSDKIVGMIEARDNNHICLFFIDDLYQGQGVGKMLFEALLLRLQGKTDSIGVNSSPYAEPIYVKLGFTKTAELTEKDGILHIPMVMSM